MARGVHKGKEAGCQSFGGPRVLEGLVLLEGRTGVGRDWLSWFRRRTRIGDVSFLCNEEPRSRTKGCKRGARVGRDWLSWLPKRLVVVVTDVGVCCRFVEWIFSRVNEAETDDVRILLLSALNQVSVRLCVCVCVYVLCVSAVCWWATRTDRMCTISSMAVGSLWGTNCLGDGKGCSCNSIWNDPNRSRIHDV